MRKLPIHSQNHLKDLNKLEFTIVIANGILQNLKIYFRVTENEPIISWFHLKLAMNLIGRKPRQGTRYEEGNVTPLKSRTLLARVLSFSRKIHQQFFERFLLKDLVRFLNE